MFIQIILLCNLKSFGCPYIIPFAINNHKRNLTSYFMPPIWKRENRSNIVSPKKKYSQGKISILWKKWHNFGQTHFVSQKGKLHMKPEKIGYVEAIALITIVMINKIILNTPKDIIAKTGTSSCLNALYISIIAIIIVCLIAKLFKNFPGYDILDISRYLGSSLLKHIIGIAYIILLIMLTASIIKSLSETLKTIYFPTSPILYVTLFFIVSSIICNRFNIKVIAKANLIIAPGIFISIIIILVSSLKNFMPQRIFPILGYGLNETFFSRTKQYIQFFRYVIFIIFTTTSW